MDRFADPTPIPSDMDPFGDGKDLPSSRPKRRRGAQPRNANALKHSLYSTLDSESLPPVSTVSPGDCLQEAITRLLSIIDRLDQLSQEAESLDDKIKLYSALGVASVRLSTLLRTQKILSPQSTDEIQQMLDQVLPVLYREWGIT